MLITYQHQITSYDKELKAQPTFKPLTHHRQNDVITLLFGSAYNRPYESFLLIRHRNAKKVVATLKKAASGQDLVKVIKAVKSKKSGAYSFKEEMVTSDEAKDYFKS